MKSTGAELSLNVLALPTTSQANIDPTNTTITMSEQFLQSKSHPMAYKIVGLAALLFISGCMSKVGNLPDEAQIKVPETWQPNQLSQTESAPGINAAEAQETKPVIGGWLNSLNDDALISHVEKALVNNPDLLSSAAQLNKAIKQVTISGSALWPQLRFNGNASNRESSAASATGGAQQGDSSSTTEIRSVGGTINIQWEADIWRKLSQRRKASALGAQAQGELYKAAELSLVANVSRAWYNLATNKLQLDLAQKRLDSFQNTAGLIEENYERGLRSALDVYLSRTDVQLQISALADSKFNYIQALRALKTLLGEYPDASLELNANLPELDGTVPAGLPAELLTRRPDVRASQLQYQAQIANAKAAHRDRFPSLTFTGSIGESRDTFNSIFDSDNSIRSLIGSLAQPIFFSGALKAQEMQAYNDAEIAYASLVKTTLTAFEEVENSLTRETVLFEQHRAIKEAVKLAQGGLDLALDRYQSGIENYTTVLQSQRSLFDSLRNELNLRNALLQNRIGIHLSLGGDFANSEDRETNKIPAPSITKTP